MLLFYGEYYTSLCLKTWPIQRRNDTKQIVITTSFATHASCLENMPANDSFCSSYTPCTSLHYSLCLTTREWGVASYCNCELQGLTVFVLHPIPSASLDLKQVISEIILIISLNKLNRFLKVNSQLVTFGKNFKYLIFWSHGSETCPN